MPRRQEKKAATREEILAAARRLFAARGWEGTTTKAVAEAAGVGAGTIFLHFPDKAALLHAALGEPIGAALAAAAGTLPPSGLLAQLTHLAGALYRMYAGDPALSRVLVKETLFLVDGAAAAESRAQIEGFLHHVAALIDAARIRGEVDRSVDPRLGAVGFFGLYFAVLVGGLRDGQTPETQLGLLRGLLDQYFRPGRRS
jgi:AcrR family transcriptional regulator